MLEGRVEHLVLYLTSGLRFEGPTTAELCCLNDEAIERGEKQAEYFEMDGRQVKISSVPDMVKEWMCKRYGNKTFDLPILPPPEHIKLRKLEILENDAMDAMSRLVIGLPHLLGKLQTLHIRSTHNLDFHFTDERLFIVALPQLSGITTLVFSVGEVFTDKAIVPRLYKAFPPNLSTLRFRGPTSLVKSEHWKEWIDAFSNPEYLPQLKKLSFVLDLFYEQRGDERVTDSRAPEDVLREARAACEELYDVVKKHGVTVELFYDEWADKCRIFRQVDDRWTL